MFDIFSRFYYTYVFICHASPSNMFSFVMRLLASRSTFLHEFAVIGTTLKSGSV